MLKWIGNICHCGRSATAHIPRLAHFHDDTDKEPIQSMKSVSRYGIYGNRREKESEPLQIAPELMRDLTNKVNIG